MPRRVGTHDAKTHLSEYLSRVAYAGERVVLERHGKPMAALISISDLQRLEALDAGQPGTEEEAVREAVFRRDLEQPGVAVHWPAGPAVAAGERHPVLLEGQLVSEQIVAERR
ncbi:MAG: type II toxin-antitoxin system Phd/YefM family antitoxin [Chloroflexi bacterium]|nr:type II toxin-antitoxin system Phd/YefM family antitoxin [Chloroflexota bacterium]